ncbi:MAG TPA: hypothetical protein G4O18_01855 [Dehalococcoidia bacterium]|nr:hypothetical protein [Dehalococcoidia bacterium]
MIKCLIPYYPQTAQQAGFFRHVRGIIEYLGVFGAILTLLLLVACNSGNKFCSDKYHIEVELPPGWAAVEGPENLFSLRYEGLVAFNSWGQNDFWARAVDMGSSDKYTASIAYSASLVASQIPSGGAYVALVNTDSPPYIDSPTEYELNDLSGLYQPHDWREVGASAYFKTFYRNGSEFQLEIYCHPDASDETLAELNDLLLSWRFLR